MIGDDRTNVLGGIEMMALGLALFLPVARAGDVVSKPFVSSQTVL